MDNYGRSTRSEVSAALANFCYPQKKHCAVHGYYTTDEQLHGMCPACYACDNCGHRESHLADAARDVWLCADCDTPDNRRNDD